jgi:hypothetical protein
MDDETPKRRPSIPQLSKTPSWVMLGFILGALFVFALPRKPPTVLRPIVLAPPEKKTITEVPRLTTIEDVFAQWAQYAVWQDDVTQVALWNAEVGDFAEFYEIRRYERVYYFRSIPHLTSVIIRHGPRLPPECPLQFTETEEQYMEWRKNGRTERPAEMPRPVFTPPRMDPPRLVTPGADAPRMEPLPLPTVDKPAGLLPKQ